MPASPSTNADARSRTSSDGLSSNSTLVAPARAAAMARWRRTFWRRCSATWGVLKARDRLSRASPTFSAASLISLAGHHEVDRGADLLGDAERGDGFGRHRCVEHG